MEVGSVIHQTQIERGTTALYVSSDGDPYLEPRLRTLYTQTDVAISSLSKWIPLDHDHFSSREEYHEAIQDFRLALDPTNETLTNVIGCYSRDNKVFIEMIGKSINVEKSVSYWTSLVAYQMLIMSKEQAGIERALGSTYYARGW
ncbi:MAG: nitrate- and nitrite sensing domain-containing protein [Candidatus Thiodiazotropha sp.]